MHHFTFFVIFGSLLFAGFADNHFFVVSQGGAVVVTQSDGEWRIRSQITDSSGP
jgi:hypothetical protein